MKVVKLRVGRKAPILEGADFGKSQRGSDTSLVHSVFFRLGCFELAMNNSYLLWLFINDVRYGIDPEQCCCYAQLSNPFYEYAPQLHVKGCEASLLLQHDLSVVFVHVHFLLRHLSTNKRFTPAASNYQRSRSLSLSKSSIKNVPSHRDLILIKTIMIP
jgi:hypothetical protein